MRIGSIQSYNPKFSGLLHVDSSNGNINDSWFYRDVATLKDAVENLKNDFPKGAEVLDFACSSGEEMISLKTLLEDAKYNIIGYDTSAEALKLGKKGVYTLFSQWYDSYLLPEITPVSNLRKSQLELKNKFHSFMREIPANKEFLKINNKISFIRMRNGMPNFIEKFYKIKDETNQLDLRLGNILNLGQFKKQGQTGAVFFRNAVYHICDNNITEAIESFMPRPDRTSCRFNILDYIVGSASKILDKNGLFVLGNNIKDHLFLADESLSINDTICFKDTPFYNPNSAFHERNANLRCYKKSPFVKALKINGFKPVGYSYVNFSFKNVKVPTIWKKIR